MSTIRAAEGLDDGGRAVSGGPSQVSTKQFVVTPYIGMIDDRRECAMNLQRFDLNLLVALDALLTEKNVTRAGRRMNLSQSAMSGALARLRGFFQDELLVPVGRRMVLTPLADDLVQPLRDVLLQVHGTITTKPRFDPASSERRFSIAVSDYVTSVLIIDLLRHVKAEAPTITFELRTVGQRAGEDLERGDLDFLIAPEEYLVPVHPTELVFEDTHTCIAWAKNPHVGSSISLDQYLELGHVIVRVGESGNHDERVLRRLNHRRIVEVVTPTFDLAPQLVVGTDRIATVPTRLACKYAKFLPLKLLPLPVDISPIHEKLQWHRAHSQDPANTWLRTQLKEAVARVSGHNTASARQADRQLGPRRAAATSRAVTPRGKRVVPMTA
jgi:LysR family nod box-dependent transcriptional activator